MRENKLQIFQDIKSIPTNSEILTLIENGTLNVIDFITSRKIVAETPLVKTSISKIDKQFEDTIISLALEEIGENKDYLINGFKVSKMESGTIYEFSKDENYRFKKRKLEKAKKELKEHETFLKAIDNEIGATPVVLFSLETGEEYRAYKPKKLSKTTIKITKEKTQ